MVRSLTVRVIENPTVLALFGPHITAGLFQRIRGRDRTCKRHTGGQYSDWGGSSDLIFTCLPRLASQLQRIMILDPMYGEYRHVVDTLLGAQIVPFELYKEEGFRID